MRNAVFTILVVLFSLSQSFAQNPINQLDANGKKQGYWEKKQPNGKLLYKGYFKDDQPVGEWKRYHENGVVKAQITYLENSDTASAQLFDDFGNKVAEGFYVDKMKAGHWVYFEKRQKVAEESYANGQKNGIATTYYPTGELFVENNYVNGVQEGVYRAYFKSGRPYFECQMKADKRDGFCQIFYQNGELETEAFYRKGVRNDEWKYFDENGKYQYSLVYDEGIVMNPAVLDSVEQIRYMQLDANKNRILDPEKFMRDPSEYMMQKGIR